MEVNEESEVLPSEDAATSSNIASDEIDQETAHKLRGDAIGDTMYSEVFVLNTLMQFSDLKWSKEVEDNLCFLWDMTEEKDVSQYLLQLSYPTLACSAILKYSEPRFIEIVVGIFANLLCSKCDKNVKEDEIKTVFNLLSSNDPYILIQVMRFVHAVAYMFDKLDFIEEEHLDRFNFVLYNSTNKELLAITLKTLSSITDSTKLNENVVKGELLKSAVTAYRTLKNACETDYDMFESQEKHLNVKHLIQFVCNMCSYIDSLKVNRLLVELNLNLDEFTSEMMLLLNYFKIKDNLLLVDEEFRFYMEALTYIYRILGVNYISPVAKVLYEIFSVITKGDSTNLECVAELFCYFISVGSLEIFRKDFENVPPHDVQRVLSYIEKQNFRFEFDYMDNLRRILNEL